MKLGIEVGTACLSLEFVLQLRACQVTYGSHGLHRGIAASVAIVYVLHLATLESL